ncbi:MAG: LytTR family DNA-binding domain-containing protein, partial [Clostridia bacterium]|nr:LytTR family DNA-binding domain-containing protein [Clostridia bacterium]
DAAKSNKVYNIAFLDIEIGDVSGLKLAELLKEKNRQIIIFFITAYEKYIDDAMDLFALRFIKKPIDHIRLYNGLDKAIKLINEDEISFYLKSSNEFRKIKAKEIVYVEKSDHKTVVVTEKNTYNTSENTDFWEAELTNVCFARPHNSFIVNMEYIESYQRKEIILADGKIIPIAYNRQKEFRRTFCDYLKRRKQ